VPLTLWFDRATISNQEVGPLGATFPPPSDTTPPETTITSAPSGTVTSTSASMGFSSSESGSTFACQLDGSAWGACSSPKSYSGLSAGTHTFSVRATDAAGNVDPTPATSSWTVSSSPPPPPPPPPTGGRLASFDGGTLTGMDQFSSLNGSVKVSNALAYDGTYSAKASLTSGGYARGIFQVAWPAAADEYYGVALYLPTNFISSMQGGVDLLRWDNYGAYGNNADYGGIEMWRDGKARLMLGKYTNDPGNVLGSPITLPTGRWFWLEVHQRFSATAGQALSEVFVDGTKVTSSTAANSYGRGIDRVRYGIVSSDNAAQTNPLSLWFDRASISSTARGPR
jgi:hypothetical protein